MTWLPKRDERGATGVEYGLLIGAIAAVIVVAAFAIGRIVSTGYADTCTRLDAEMTAVSETCA